ncbi:2-hydroxyacyl-CoA dehydratase [Polymorphobacter sp.]|uniref:2-hydroxyacyl-CoA dehydratase n=1 Tax=Polymorphobacter sp. TaxID=1909290 RepID=UPI003F721BCA
MARAALQAIAAAVGDEDAFAAQLAASGARAIRTLGVDAPLTLLRAAGFLPVRLTPTLSEATPRADALLGKSPIGPRARRLLERLLQPSLADAPILITHADEEQVQVFNALRALARMGDPGPRHVHMLDLLHQPRDATRQYNEKRIARLLPWLVERGGTIVDDEALAGQAQREEPLRASLAKLDGMRAASASPITGVEALQVAAATAILPPEDLVGLVEAIIAEQAPSSSANGAERLFVTGSDIEDDRVFAALEADGAVIVGDDLGWGLTSRSAPAPCTLAEAADPSRARPPGQIAPRARAEAAIAMADGRAVDRLVHVMREGDEAAAWGFAPLARTAGHRPVRRITPGLQPRPDARPSSDTGRPAPVRARKLLAAGKAFGTFQRDWFAEIVATTAAGAPLAVVNANAPQEILRALGVPFVINQWWASIVAAKQQSRRFAALLGSAGYPADAEAYSAQGVASALDSDQALAPWGGLPRPRYVQAVTSTDATLGIYDAWAHETGATPYLYERSVDPRWQVDCRWWDDLPDKWDEVIEPERLDLMVAELREMAAMVTSETGRPLDDDRLREVMTLVNEQERSYLDTRDRIAEAPSAPITIVDSMPATMIPQWHRGTAWARDAAREFHDEVAARVDRGDAAVADERVRLMWVGRGLWSNISFYQTWEESHGAVFVWSMYLALAADGYIRAFDRGRDPLRALAARFVTMGDELRTPCWAGPWHVHEAETHRVDGVVALSDADPFVLRALTDAGIPVLALDLDNYTSDAIDHRLVARVTAFIEGPAAKQAQQRRRTVSR